MKESYISGLVQSVNASAFIKYFDLFAANYLYRSNKVFFQSFSSEGWCENSKGTIASTGKRIFRESLEKEVLEFISKHCDKETSSKAKAILKRYSPSIESNDPMLNRIIEKIESADFSPIKGVKTYKEENIKRLQRNILNSLKDINENFKEEYQMRENYRDKADIFCEMDDYCVIIELDATRADQVAKKFVSRTALNFEKKIIYIAICYPRKETTPIQELKKYFMYCKSIILNIDANSSFTGVLIDGKGVKEVQY